jgi:arylsulfatase A-like enzyme/Flp pilus assembly protein TadD
MKLHRSSLCGACALIIALLASRNGSEGQGAVAAASPPLRPVNLLVVTVDTLRPDHLHCYGYSKIETPNMDAIAVHGALFENAVTQTPLTPPSHASIFTGLNPPSHHVRDTGGFVLQSSSTTLATILQRQGWNTAAFISSAVLKKLFGLNQGFAVYDDQMPRPGKGHEFDEDAERRAGETIDHALRWLEAQSGKPFFLWVHIYDPHAPYQPPAPYREKYRDRLYDGEIAYADHELGRLFDAVHKKSPDKTLIAVLSDHGESLGEHGEYTHGVFLYDSTLRIVFMLSGPGVPAGARIRQQARTIDFLPTILDLMGGKPPVAVEGASLTPYFAGKDARTAVSYAETLYPKINMGWAELRAIRTNHWKYIRAPKPELYDLSQDPAEAHNVIRSNAPEVQKFEANLNVVIGAGGTEKVRTVSIDERTLSQLKSLGYISGFASRSYDLQGQGIDPKDRVGVLKLLEMVENAGSRMPAARRIEILRQALAGDPADPHLYYELGEAYERADRQDDAMKLYRAAAEQGIQSGRLHSRIGDLLVRAGRKDEAIPEYEKAAQFNPADLQSQANLATAYLEKGRLDDAERVYKWTIAVDAGYGTAYNGLGVIAIQKQDPTTARGYFEKAVQLDPDLADAQLNLGLIYKMAGDRERARACFQAFLAKASPAQYGEVIPKVREELAELQ